MEPTLAPEKHLLPPRQGKGTSKVTWKCGNLLLTLPPQGRDSWDQSQETEELKTIGNKVPRAPPHTLTHSNQKLETEPMTAGPTPELLLKGQIKAASPLVVSDASGSQLSPTYRPTEQRD